MFKRIRNKLYVVLALVITVITSSTVLAQSSIPTGRPITLQEVLLLFEDIAGFLIIAGGILAGITIILSGIFYLMSGGDATKTKSAKDMLKAGLIGALIIFGFGVIINTVQNFAENPLQFFGGGAGSPYCVAGIRSGQSCTSNNDCPNDPPGTCGGSGQVLCSYSLCFSP